MKRAVESLILFFEKRRRHEEGYPLVNAAEQSDKVQLLVGKSLTNSLAELVSDGSNWEEKRKAICNAFILFIPKAFVNGQIKEKVINPKEWQQLSAEERKKTIQEFFESDDKLAVLFQGENNPRLNQIAEAVEEAIRNPEKIERLRTQIEKDIAGKKFKPLLRS